MKFSTKAKTLDNLKPILKSAKILPQICFTVKDWQTNSKKILNDIDQKQWQTLPLIIRSSSLDEDTTDQSLAGHYLSINNVVGQNNVIEAINKVIESYCSGVETNQIFIQPTLQKVLISGVVFTRDPNTNGPYIVINYDDTSGKTDTVSSGTSNKLNTLYIYKLSDSNTESEFKNLVALATELELIFDTDCLDIEFAISQDKELYLFQVRPLHIKATSPIPKETHQKSINDIYHKIKQSNQPHPYLNGDRAVYGIMPDWNPAEIIGIRPGPLALSLYKELITDNIWAYQRDNYGYKNLRSFPLLIHFCGLPYIDVRVSFNSFIPSDIKSDLAEKLVNYYIDRLIQTPSYHDKVEFEIVFSCYTLDLPERLKVLYDFGFNNEDYENMKSSLKNLTNKIIHNKTGLWRKDIEKIGILKPRIDTILNSSLDDVSKIYWLIEDCKRYGTLPFAGLARAGFIAVQLLQSLVKENIINENEYHNFMNGLDTVTSRMMRDFRKLQKEPFLKEYGHLRPGTYDILSPRYDETPDRYFDFENIPETDKKNSAPFSLSLNQLKAIENSLKKHGLVNDVLEFFDFIKQTIEGREYAKFIFTYGLSNILTILGKLSKRHGFSLEDCSYVDIDIISKLYTSSEDVKQRLAQNIQDGKEHYKLTQQILLPPIITSPDDVFVFKHLNSEPNYITLLKSSGNVMFTDNERQKLKNSILMIPSADPGFDWIFSCGINGFITMYGGANSHMAIRAAELEIPAIIGTGEMLYNEWAKANSLEIDCLNNRVTILR